MKKVTAILLVICMSFLLCAASSSRLCSCGCECGEKCACGKTNELKTASNQDGALERNDYNDAIIVEDARAEIKKGSKTNGFPTIRIFVKVRNNYTPADGTTYADRIMWDVQILDENGDTLITKKYSYDGFDYGDAVWVFQDEALDMTNGIFSGIRVKTYSLYQMGSSKNATFLGNGKITEPKVFPIEIDITQ